MQVGIVEPGNFSEKAILALRSLGSVELHSRRDDLKSFLWNKEVIFIRLKHFVGGEFLDWSPSLHTICSPTTGFTHFDLDAIRSRGVSLLTLKGEVEFLEGIRATPEHTFGLILALLRNYHRSFLRMDVDSWDRDSLKGTEIYGRKIGIIGYGRVGRRVGKYCLAFEAEVRFFDITEIENDPGVTRETTLEELIRWSDVVVLSASYCPGGPPILERDHIKLLTGKYLINTARGELVDEECLIASVMDSSVAGVAIDVIQNEHGSNRIETWKQLTLTRNVIVTPHIGGATLTSMQRTEEFLAEKLVRKYKGEIGQDSLNLKSQS